MAFMTAASLRNPNTLGKSLLGIGEDLGRRKQRDQISTVAREVQEGISNLSQQDQMNPTAVNNMVKSVFDRNPGLPPQAQQMAIKMAHDAQSKMMQSKSFQQGQTLFGQGQEDRERLLQKERVGEADVSLLGKLQNLKQSAMGEISPAGVEGEYSAPETKASLLGGLSYGGRRQFESDKMAKEKHDASLLLKRDMGWVIDEYGNKVWTDRKAGTVSSPDKAKGLKGKKFAQAGKLIESITKKYSALDTATGDTLTGEAALTQKVLEIQEKYQGSGFQDMTAAEKRTLRDYSKVKKLVRDRQSIYQESSSKGGKGGVDLSQFDANTSPERLLPEFDAKGRRLYKIKR